MKRIWSLLLVAVVWLLPQQGTHAQQSRQDAPRMLFVTQSAGFRHRAVTRRGGQLAPAEQVMKQLAVSSNLFRVDCTQDVQRDFTKENLANYRLVMFYTTGKLPIPKETLDWFLNVWLKKQGNGFLGVHSATDTFKDYQPFWDMIGGTFNGHPWNARSRVTITVHEPDHPICRPWGREFEITDEIYRFRNWQPEKVRVLMSLNMAKTSLKAPYHVPVAWVKQYGKGRVAYISLGHRIDVWHNPKYQQSLLGAVRWLLKLEDAPAEPNPELSAAEEEKAKAAYEQAKRKK